MKIVTFREIAFHLREKRSIIQFINMDDRLFYHADYDLRTLSISRGITA
jgi:hypothetical protein